MKDKTRNILLFGVLIAWAVLHAYIIYHYKCDSDTQAGPVVAPTSTTQQEQAPDKTSFGSENYIWDNWK